MNFYPSQKTCKGTVSELRKKSANCRRGSHSQKLAKNYGVFLGVTETIVGQLLCRGVGNVQCLFNLLYCVTW